MEKYSFTDVHNNKWECEQMDLLQVDMSEYQNGRSVFENDITVKNNEVIGWYEKYKNGTMSKKEYIEKMYLKLRDFIAAFVRKRNQLGEFEDLVANGVQNLVEKIDEYNPYKSMPTTWMSQQLYKIVDLPAGMTTHYVTIIRNLNKVAIENGYNSALECPAQKLAVLADESLTSVVNAMKLASVTIVADDEQLGMVGTTESPEHMVLEKEKNSIVREMFDILSPLEKYVVSLSLDNDSTRQILEKINTPENLELFNIKKLTAQSFSKIKNVALSKMRDHSGSYLFEERKGCYIFEEEFEQASEEDLLEIEL